MQKIPNVLVVASKEIGLETNTGEISIWDWSRNKYWGDNYTIMSGDQNTGQNDRMKDRY
jgi:hypothetical protein